MVELDVQMTRDGELVCFHDWNLERLGGRSETIEQSESSALTRITIAPDGSRIPLLEVALAALPEPAPINIEIKRRRAHRGKLARVLLEHLDGRSQVLVSSFDFELLGKLRELAPELPLAPIERHQPRKLLETGQAIDAFSLHCHSRLVTRHFIERAAGEGFDRVLAYTVNDEHLAKRLFEDGVSGVFTDQPSKLVEHFKGSG